MLQAQALYDQHDCYNNIAYITQMLTSVQSVNAYSACNNIYDVDYRHITVKRFCSVLKHNTLVVVLVCAKSRCMTLIQALRRIISLVRDLFHELCSVCMSCSACTHTCDWHLPNLAKSVCD